MYDLKILNCQHLLELNVVNSEYWYIITNKINISVKILQVEQQQKVSQSDFQTLLDGFKMLLVGCRTVLVIEIRQQLSHVQPICTAQFHLYCLNGLYRPTTAWLPDPA